MRLLPRRRLRSLCRFLQLKSYHIERAEDERKNILILIKRKPGCTPTALGLDWLYGETMMKCIFIGALALALGATQGAWAQDLDDLNVQIHGYVTQGFLYSTNNDVFSTTSSNGTPAWTEAVINVSAKPTQKLRIAAQGRYFLLGQIGNAISLDWAEGDYKQSDRFGVRFGKVKTPDGLFNETQDIDPSYLWSLLPQGNYLVTSRNSQLAHFGGVAYGAIDLGEHAGKLEYRGFSGERVLAADDGFYFVATEHGLLHPDGIKHLIYGAALRWRTPVPGLMVGASNIRNHASTDPISGVLTGRETFGHSNKPDFFARYEKSRFTLAGEYTRDAKHGTVAISQGPILQIGTDPRSWFVMTAFKATKKLEVGAYTAQSIDHGVDLGPLRDFKDWVVSSRYDPSQFVYLKFEQHFIHGNGIGIDVNPSVPAAPDTRLTILKIGVSF